jgi:hypothetical protein
MPRGNEHEPRKSYPAPVWVERYREAANQETAYAIIRAAGLKLSDSDRQFLQSLHIKGE